MARDADLAYVVTAAADGAPPLLQIEVSESAQTATVKVSGELDLSNVALLKQRIEPLLLDQRQVITFDLEHLRFIDSSGIGLLLSTAAKVGSVRLRHPSEIVRQVLNYTGLDGVLAVDP